MKVKTIRQHINPHPPRPEKRPGRVYDLPDGEAEALIAEGLVEAATDDADQADGVQGIGKSPG